MTRGTFPVIQMNSEEVRSSYKISDDLSLDFQSPIPEEVRCNPSSVRWGFPYPFPITTKLTFLIDMI